MKTKLDPHTRKLLLDLRATLSFGLGMLCPADYCVEIPKTRTRNYLRRIARALKR